MARSVLSPLPFNVPIVDPETGHPLPFFQRMLADWLKEKAAAETAALTLENLGGDPGADRLIQWDDSAGEFVFITASEALDLIGSEVHGDILYRDSTGWALLAAGTDGKVLTTHGASADPTWETPSASGGGAWALQGAGQTATGIYDQAVDGTKATVDFTGLSGTDIMIITHNITKSVSGVTALRLSVNNGSSYYSTSGDYLLTGASGAGSNSDFMSAFHSTNATAARSGTIMLPAAGLDGIPKVNLSFNGGGAECRLFLASTSPVNAVRIMGHAGGNITGGKIYCLTR